MIVSMLMQRLEKSTMKSIVPIQAIAVLPLVLQESAKSMTFSDVAFTSLIDTPLTRHLFLWERKADGSIKLASILRLVTFSVSKIYLKHMGSTDLRHDPNLDLSQVDTGKVLLHGQL